MRKFLTAGVEVELLFQETVGQPFEPYWSLAGREIWAHFPVGEQEYEAFFATAYGSWPFLWSGEDTVLFSKESRLLYNVSLKLPDTVQVVNRDFCTSNCVQGSGQLLLPQGIKFSLDRVGAAAYNQQTDIYFFYLVAAEGEQQDFSYDCSLEVFPDLFILFHQQHYVGWKLQQASTHLTSSEHKPLALPLTTPSLRAYLADYFTFFTDSMAEQMEDRDERVRLQLLAFQAEVARQQDARFQPISEGLLNLLDVYYGI
jgi:hypothetical protein